MWQQLSKPNTNFWSPTNEGDKIEGYLINILPNQGKFKNSTIYTLLTKEGERQVWGSTILDQYLQQISLGTKVQLVYSGKVPTKNGTSIKKWEVFIDPEDIYDIKQTSDLEDFKEDI